ncbi:flagellar biosynthetic protein FliO [Burkholderia multivorans]|jgi:flagellar protein FliO/FliZ|uniref:Flagellar protein n=1 Tax=Burkholderia multivorans TaxID=87883 RepID=A0AAP2MRK6_9BURK|nr:MULTISPECIES: flagellar biosynthetic protein FliO [Burkholderia]AJY18423.1 flagellar biosynthetic protein FliO [Burkholderia multivorans ATCC BAA-247]AVR20651.1 flagellar biosynthetic protein FliO [Burkholderia multivorans]KOE27967.1 flagellar biosynthesis protein FliO [Burkholderia multivorans R-20526]MBU9185314.1 flagellar biosynthetic protein FliO [Burkholderia multivorans]MBU9244164.1 flagellar biosynthetic protein FliO [Burkholderia multivorans]
MSVAPSGRRAAFAAAAACAASAVGMPACGADLNAVNHAGAIASSVVVGSAAPSLGVGAVLQTLVGLAVVIGLVFGCAWLARRFGFQPARRGGPLKVVSSVAVGAKESATIVEIGDTWLVLGVAPGNVRLLHTLPAGSVAAVPVDAPAGVAPSGRAAPGSGELSVNGASFGARFRDALAGEAAKRLGRGKER